MILNLKAFLLPELQTFRISKNPARNLQQGFFLVDLCNSLQHSVGRDVA